VDYKSCWISKRVKTSTLFVFTPHKVRVPNIQDSCKHTVTGTFSLSYIFSDPLYTRTNNIAYLTHEYPCPILYVLLYTIFVLLLLQLNIHKQLLIYSCSQIIYFSFKICYIMHVFSIHIVPILWSKNVHKCTAWDVNTRDA